MSVSLANPNSRNLTWLGTVVARLAPALTFLGSFLVYFFTLAPTVYRLGSAELGTVAYNLGVPHATGYPLYVLIGKLFTYLPIGDVGYRLNLMSALFGAGTATVAYLLASLVSRRPIVSLAVSGSLAFSYYFWASAVVAEVYTLKYEIHSLLRESVFDAIPTIALAAIQTWPPPD